MAANVLHKKFTFEELENIRINFKAGDLNNDSVLDLKEFNAIMSSSQFDEKDTTKLFTLFDKDGNGKISFDEFIQTLAIMTKGTATQKLEFMFKFYDTDGDGKLSTTETKTLINHIIKIGTIYLGSAKNAEVGAQAITKGMDTDEDGGISLPEWIAFGSENPEFLQIFGLA